MTSENAGRQFYCGPSLPFVNSQIVKTIFRQRHYSIVFLPIPCYIYGKDIYRGLFMINTSKRSKKGWALAASTLLAAATLAHADFVVDTIPAGTKRELVATMEK
jgi:hypothetical protein